jgi:hypothetical protein
VLAETHIVPTYPLLDKKERDCDDDLDDIMHTVSQRSFVLPLQETMKKSFAAGWDDPAKLPSELRPKLPDHCKCDDSCRYDEKTGSTIVAYPNIYFSRGVRNDVAVFSVDCPHRNPACRVVYEGSDWGLWICSLKTVISVSLFLDAINAVRVWSISDLVCSVCFFVCSCMLMSCRQILCFGVVCASCLFAGKTYAFNARWFRRLSNGAV